MKTSPSIRGTYIVAAGFMLLMLWAVPRLSAQQTDTLVSPDTAPAERPVADTIPVSDGTDADTVITETGEAAVPVSADTAAVPGETDTTVVRKEEREIAISSGKAMLYSAIIPGGGQFYNGKYWKIPIVYGGFVALGIAIEFNQSYYSEFVRELNYRGDGDPLTVPKYDEEVIPNSRIIEARNYYRRYRDLCIIGVGVLYGLNIVDAYVDAELSNFDISEDLSMKLSPSMQYDPTYAAAGMGVAPGFSLTLGIR